MRTLGDTQSWPLWCAAVFLIGAIVALGGYGWIVNGSSIFLAMSDSLAAWCM